jgi:K+-transporting ATPase A subunit
MAILCAGHHIPIESICDWHIAPILGNAGPHGFSEILYAYASATNGSAFAGLTTNTTFAI